MRARAASDVLASIAANVRAQRAQLGLSQAQLAERADLELRHLQRIERGRTNFGVVTLVWLAEALGVRPGTLLRRSALPPTRHGRPPRE
ncbi:MAG: helix-turn-helix transcriptional regulator [Deltaproteobacteria bacterium]|nr:helix-turn-helix transcriptional regulator [Deltaproteobacteria bacterium]